MKNIINILYSVIFFTLVVVMNIDAAENSQSIQKITASQANNVNNDLLVKILENAHIVVRQIQENALNTAERKLALTEIARAENLLSKNAKTPLLINICTIIKKHTQTIKDESKKFADHRKPLVKYNPVPAETALTALANEIKKASGDLSESFVVTAYQAVERATIETERITKQANKIINDTSLQAAKNEITPAQAARIIGKQKNVIEQAQLALQKEKENAQKAVAQNDMQSGYVHQIATGIYNVGAKILSPLKAGYGNTEQEKQVARAIIAELETQINMQTTMFNDQMQQPGLDVQQKQALANKHKAVMQELNTAIHDQQLITGDAMSTSRKLFWAAVTGVGIGTAAYYGYQKFAPVAKIKQEGRKSLSSAVEFYTEDFNNATRSMKRRAQDPMELESIISPEGEQGLREFGQSAVVQGRAAIEQGRKAWNKVVQEAPGYLRSAGNNVESSASNAVNKTNTTISDNRESLTTPFVENVMTGYTPEQEQEALLTPASQKFLDQSKNIVSKKAEELGANARDVANRWFPGTRDKEIQQRRIERRQKRQVKPKVVSMQNSED